MLKFFMCLSALWIDGCVYTVLFLIVCVIHYVGSHLVGKKQILGRQCTIPNLLEFIVEFLMLFYLKPDGYASLYNNFWVVNPMQFKATRTCANGFSLPRLPHTLFPKYLKDNANFHFQYIKLNMCLCSAQLRILSLIWYTWSSISSIQTFERVLTIY